MKHCGACGGLKIGLAHGPGGHAFVAEGLELLEAAAHPEGRCADCGRGKNHWMHHDKAKSAAPDDYHAFRSEKDVIVIGKQTSIGDPAWGMYVTPDDPQRDTPEKARAYYVALFERYPQLTWSGTASAQDLDAAATVLGRPEPKRSLTDGVLRPDQVQAYTAALSMLKSYTTLPPAPSSADLAAVHAVIGCVYEGCEWEGVVDVSFSNFFGKDFNWRLCRAHSAQYRDDPQYTTKDSNRPNRKLLNA